MKTIVRRAVVAVLGLAVLAGTAVSSLAMPPASQAGGKNYCRCLCRTGNALEKNLDWEMGPGGCGSNNKSCQATFDGGKTFRPGYLMNCATCTPNKSTNVWACTPALMMNPTSKGNLSPATPPGTLQQR
jgi:hypothetical protein